MVSRRIRDSIAAVLVATFSGAADPVVAQSGSAPDRGAPINARTALPEFGFRSPTGLIVVLRADAKDNAQWYDLSHAPFFFPGQMNVKTANGGIALLGGGAGGSYSQKRIADYTFFFERGGMEKAKAKLHGDPLLNGQNNDLNLFCPAQSNLPNSASPYFDQAAQNYAIPLTPLTPAEMDILKTRLTRGDIKLYNPPGLYHTLDAYPLPDGTMLLLANDVSTVFPKQDRGYVFAPDKKTWREHKAEYHSPGAPHEKMGVGWDTDIGFLKYNPAPGRALWFARQGEGFADPVPVNMVPPNHMDGGALMQDLLKSPQAGALIQTAPNPCDLSPTG